VVRTMCQGKGILKTPQKRKKKREWGSVPATAVMLPNRSLPPVVPCSFPPWSNSLSLSLCVRFGRPLSRLPASVDTYYFTPLGCGEGSDIG
jgi:hypothetical protein